MVSSGEIHAAHLPHPARTTSDVARHPHREVVVGVDVLHDATLAVDLDPLETGARPDVVGYEVAQPTGAVEQFVDAAGNGTSDQQPVHS